MVTRCDKVNDITLSNIQPQWLGKVIYALPTSLSAIMTRPYIFIIVTKQNEYEYSLDSIWIMETKCISNLQPVSIIYGKHTQSY